MTTLDLTPRTAQSPTGSLGDTAALVGRCLRRSTRQLDTLLLAVMLPVMLLLMFVYVFGGALDAGMEYIDFVVPGIVLLTAGYGAATTAVDVATDVTAGIMDRFRSMPIRATGVMTGHVVASMARNAVSTALVVGIALLIGFDAHASLLGWVAAIGLIALYVAALTWIAVAIGVVASGPEAASGFTFAILFIPYVSSAFVPVESMPSALEHVAHGNPVTPVADTLRALLLGTPAGSSAGAAIAWCVGLLLVGWVAAGLLFRRQR
ncbi:ABC transporter permease [Cellulomonas edaphi]|uniref:Transport permease protein n=1 Tax=Cellulomonas edaphi TaxID=3053468 RepID=A0ABT7S3P2_9CELL|nr:ABC transporter permease [Cellulomons edaphi]MDM7830238.1 ABC transporter permease [Cellulomons edaphi]